MPHSPNPPAAGRVRSRVRGLLPLFLLPLACVLLPCRPARAAYPYAKLNPATLKFRDVKFNPPEPHREMLPNGMEVYLLEDHELPLFSATAYVKTGSIYEPADKVGLAGLTGEVLRSGGTETEGGDQLDEELEFLAASVESGIGAEIGTVGMSCLAKDTDRVTQLWADVLMHPAFPQAKLDLAKAGALEAIRRRNDDPEGIASREFAKLIYGPTNPWARVSSVASINSITRDDLLAFYHRYYKPNNMILAIAGDFSTPQMMDRLRTLFGSWKKGPVDFPAVAPVPSTITPGVFFVPRDVTQSVVEMGHLGMPRLMPDRPAVDVMNYILGGGFNSRLTEQVRSNHGYAYDVGGGVETGRDRGLFVVEAKTRSGSTVAATELMRRIISQMQTVPVTDQELKLAKDAQINSFIFLYTSAAKIVNQRAEFEMLGFPPGYLRTFPDKIRKVTKADVMAAARKWLQPSRMVVLVVGNPKQFDRPLTALGSPTEIHISGPGATGAGE